MGTPGLAPPFADKSSSCAVWPRERGAPAVASGLSIAIEAARTRARNSKTEKEHGDHRHLQEDRAPNTPGEIFTLSLQAKGVRLVPDLRASGENAPSHRVLVGRAEIGAAWTKKSNEGREYLA